MLLLVAWMASVIENGTASKHPQDEILTPAFRGTLILSFGWGMPLGTSNMASGVMGRGLKPKTVVLVTALLTPVSAVHPGCLVEG